MDDVDTVIALYPRIYFALHTRHVREPGSDRTLSAHQASVLDHLDADRPTRLGDLAAHMGVTAATMSVAVKRLATLGFVARAADADDARVVLLRLTTRGVAMRKAGSVLDPELVEKAMASLTPEGRAAVVRGLAVLADAARGVK